VLGAPGNPSPELLLRTGEFLCRRPGGDGDLRGGGGGRGGFRASYRRARRAKLAGHRRIEGGGRVIARSNLARIFRPEEEESVGADILGPHVSVRERWRPVPVRKRIKRAVADSGAGLERRPRPIYFVFSFFSLFLFCFLISFITFAFQKQTRSNQLQKFSKIKNNISRQ
jgi:hypothetical protein